MITKTIVFLLSMSFAFMYDTTNTPLIIPVDIEFCDHNKAFEKSICYIQEAEFSSNNRLVIDQNGKLNDILEDKRSITSEKASAIFSGAKSLLKIESLSMSLIYKKAS